jgi:peptidoglycan/LPS O-acetylase OafA/YrhL
MKITPTVKKDPLQRYAYIDALRGIAILMVIFGHTYPKIADLPSWIKAFGFQGGRGVQLFFMVSALTLFMSLNTRKAFDKRVFVNFFIRRFFRIAPLFYSGIVLYTLLDGFKPRIWAPDGIGWWHIVATATFMHGWHPTTFNSVVPGGWSIAVEIMFYLCLPFLFLKIKKTHVAACAVIITLIGALLIKNYAIWFLRAESSFRPYLVETLTKLWFPSQLPIFMLGIFLFFLIKKPAPATSGETADSYRAWLYMVVFLFLFSALPFGKYTLIPDYFVYGVAFMCLIYSLALQPNAIFVNRTICYIGKISYSCYIYHFFVIRLVAELLREGYFPFFGGLPATLQLIVYYLLTTGITIVFAFLSYRYIEETGIQMGRRIIGRLERR